MATCSGVVSSSQGGLVLTFTDTGSYGTVTSRNLNIYDALGNLLAYINMGPDSTVATYNNTVDQYLSFNLIVLDTDGGPYTCERDYLAEGIALALFLNWMSTIGCGCSPKQFLNLLKGEFNLTAAERMALSGFGVIANTLISRANTYFNLP